MDAYREEKNIRTLEKINDLTVDMPMFMRRFANEYLVTKNKSPRTVLGYVGDLKVFFEYLEKTRGIPVMQISIETLGSLTADDIQDYLLYLMRYNRKDPNNSKTIKESNQAPARARKLSSLRALYRYLIAHNHLEKNVAELVDMPKIEEKPITYLEKEEVRDVLEGAETGGSLTKRQFTFSKGQQMRDIAILTLLLNTGIRVSEMVGIDLQDIDWNEKRIRIFRKGRKEQFIYFNEPVAEALQDYLDCERKASSEDLNALFISRKGQRISVRAVERLVKKYTASVVPMKRITPHKLRSTFATNLYEETGDIYVTSDALGHSSLETVKKYTNLHDERRRRAAEAIEKAYYNTDSDTF
ncbi:MAG TPA: integrase [Lachnospiraceae bacterium]|nr:integrase [Lachnospiraceae bacterium]